MERNRKEGDVEFARALRCNATKGEKRFWAHIRRSNYGFKFRRQHPIEGFVLDFYSPILSLAFEIDGPFHDSDRDAIRDRIFADKGIKTVRLKSLPCSRPIGTSGLSLMLMSGFAWKSSASP